MKPLADVRAHRAAAALAALARARAIGRLLTPAEAETVLADVDPVDRPALVFDLYDSRILPLDALRAVLMAAWLGVEFPKVSLSRGAWLDLFRAAAYPPPEGSLTVYRGTIPRYARGMAWAAHRERAQWFADRWSRTGRRAHVYTVVAEPGSVLAEVGALDAGGGHEGEIVVDPTMLSRLRRT